MPRTTGYRLQFEHFHVQNALLFCDEIFTWLQQRILDLIVFKTPSCENGLLGSHMYLRLNKLVCLQFPLSKFTQEAINVARKWPVDWWTQAGRPPHLRSDLRFSMKVVLPIQVPSGHPGTSAQVPSDHPGTPAEVPSGHPDMTIQTHQHKYPLAIQGYTQVPSGHPRIPTLILMMLLFFFVIESSSSSWPLVSLPTMATGYLRWYPGWPLGTCADVTAWPLGTCVGILDGHWVRVLMWLHGHWVLVLVSWMATGYVCWCDCMATGYLCWYPGWPLGICADVIAWPLDTCVGILDGHWVLVLLCLDYFVQWIAIAAVGSVHRSTAEQRFALWPLATFERR